MGSIIHLAVTLPTLNDIEFVIAYVGIEGSFLRTLHAPAGISIADALHHARETCEDFPECAWTHARHAGVALHGVRLENLSNPLKGGERLEILRPLVLDPAEARRLRSTRG